MYRALAYARLAFVFRWPLVFCCPALLAAQQAPPPPIQVSAAAPDALMNLKFASTQGWIGSDAVYSVPLPDDSMLWIFGDTLVGTIRDGKRHDILMVNNSFAKQRGWGAAAEVQLLLKRDSQGKATSFVAPENKPGYFWLWDGIVEHTNYISSQRDSPRREQSPPSIGN